MFFFFFFSRMVPSISLRWKAFGVNFRACSKPHVIQPIVSKSLPYKGELRFKGWEKEKGNGGGGNWRKGSSSLGEGLEEWVKYKGRPYPLFFKWSLFLSLPDPGCGVPLTAFRRSPYSRCWVRETGRGLL